MTLKLNCILRTSDGHVVFKVTEQSTRLFRDYHAPNGLTIASESGPEWKHGRRTLYVRGCDTSCDNHTLTCTSKEWKEICDAVVAFNKYYAMLAEVPIGRELIVSGTSGTVRLIRSGLHSAVLLMGDRHYRLDEETMPMMTNLSVRHSAISTYLEGRSWRVVL